MIIGGRQFDTKKKTYIMGILNLTPDSFSDGGTLGGAHEALERVRRMIDEGADIIDVGGESTRPGYTRISEEEEIARILPVIELIKREFDIPVSVDTYKSKVALAALRAGADMVNDIWGFKYDADMANVVASFGAACCLMHNRENAVYKNFLSELSSELLQCVQIALRAGVDADKIILDPGIGFGKTPEMNLMLLNNADKLDFKYPLLFGASRKSFIYHALGLPVERREQASVAAAVIAAYKGASFVRVHNVKAHRHAVDMARAVAASGGEK